MGFTSKVLMKHIIDDSHLRGNIVNKKHSYVVNDPIKLPFI